MPARGKPSADGRFGRKGPPGRGGGGGGCSPEEMPLTSILRATYSDNDTDEDYGSPRHLLSGAKRDSSMERRVAAKW